MIEDSGNSNRAPYKGCCDSLPPSKSLRGERYDEYVSPMPIYQLIDSNAPTGGFAHSNTVEAAFQLGLITKSVDKRNGLCSPRSPYYRSLKLHVYDVLLNTVSTMVPYVVSACDLLYCISAKDSSLTTVGNSNQLYQVCDRFQCIDEELGATLTSHVSRRASSVQGLGILRAFGRTFPSMSEILSSIKTRLLDSSVTDLDDVDSDGGRAGHAATCFAAVCGLAGIHARTCVSMFMYITTRDMVNAAVRMNIVGPLEGGCLINELCSNLEILLNQLLTTADDGCTSNNLAERRTCDAAPNRTLLFTPHQVAPVVEILANAHDRLYTRLFNS